MTKKNCPAGLAENPQGLSRISPNLNSIKIQNRQEVNNLQLFYVPSKIPNSNKFILHLEKLELVKMLTYNLRSSRYSFIDKRHKILASCITCFMDNYPEDQYNTENFISYLSETNGIECCGGEHYVQEIFSGIGEEA